MEDERKILWRAWNMFLRALTESNPGKLFQRGRVDEKVACISFDDAPDEKNTVAILDILKEFNVKSSFSVEGRFVEQYPHIVKRIFEEGHLIINHTWNHLHLPELSMEEIQEEIISTENIILQVLGIRTAIIRQPYGDINQSIVDAMEPMGYKSVLWSVDTIDWMDRQKESIVKNATEGVKPGDIILMHCCEGREATVEALPDVISYLRDEGYNFLDVSELLGIKAYK